MTDTPEVLVVGAGIVGASVAYACSARGARVTILDARRPACGATQASAGMLAPYLEGHSAELRALTVAALGRYDDFVTQLSARAHAGLEYARTGTLQVATRAEHVEAITQQARDLTSLGVSARLMDRRELVTFEPAVSPTVSGGLFIPAHGLIGAVAMTEAMLAFAATKGARVVTGRRVVRIAALPEGRGVVCHDESGQQWEAPHVVLAAGSWASLVAIDGVPALPVRPVRGQLVYLQCGALAPSRILWGARCYLVPWSDGTTLVGATVEDVGYDERVTSAGVSDLLHAAKELLAVGGDAEFIGARVGLRPGSPDDRPLVGPSTRIPGLCYAVGHYRNGVMLAPLTGDVLADWILEGRADDTLDLMRPQRFGDL